MYQMNHIQIQVLQILIHRIHLDHHTTSIINGGKVQKRIKRNDGVKSVSMNLSKSAQSLHPNYLHLRTSQRSWGSNWMRIHYSARFISYISFMHFKIISNFQGTYMFLMDCPSIRREYFPDSAKKATWNLLHVYIDARSQILIYQYP